MLSDRHRTLLNVADILLDVRLQVRRCPAPPPQVHFSQRLHGYQLLVLGMIMQGDLLVCPSACSTPPLNRLWAQMPLSKGGLHGDLASSSICVSQSGDFTTGTPKAFRALLSILTPLFSTSSIMLIARTTDAQFSELCRQVRFRSGLPSTILMMASGLDSSNIPRQFFFNGVGGERIDPRRVHENYIRMPCQHPSFLSTVTPANYRHTGLNHKGIKEGGFSGVRIGNGYLDGHGNLSINIEEDCLELQ